MANNFAKAERLSRRIVSARPEHANALQVLGIACRDQGRPDEAIGYLERSVAADASFPDTHSNLGAAYAAAGRYEDAVVSFKKAIELRPRYVTAIDNLGLAHKELGQHEEAIDCFRRVQKLEPKRLSALSEVAHLTRQVCDWESFEGLRSEMIQAVQSGAAGINPFWLLSYVDDPALLLKCASKFGADEIGQCRPIRAQPKRGDKICLAYLSADFREHPVAHQLLPIIEGHDRSRFEIVGVSFGPDDQSEARKHMADAFDEFIDVTRLSDEDAAKAVAKTGAHVAIDLMGYTANLRPRILAHRPTPIQVNYLGYPGSMGAEHIDHIVADPNVIPTDHEAHFSENIVRLPDSYMVSSRPTHDSLHVPTRAEAGLPAQGPVFCAFNNVYKITPRMFRTWMNILAAVPDSVLWLRSDDETVQSNLRQEAEARGICSDRLIFAPRVDYPTHLGRQKLADVFLDTDLYNAHATACDALWVELPIVTLAGDTFSGRVGESLLRASGLPELIASSFSDYERLAVELVTNTDKLAALKAKLAAQREASPLFDVPRFVKNLEEAYTEMFERWAGGKATQALAV